MSENDKPIFPRSSDTDEAEKQKLYQETKQKLDDAEKPFPSIPGLWLSCPQCRAEVSPSMEYCQECGAKIFQPMMPPPQTLYGPPSMLINEKGEFHPRPAYGSPPMPIVKNKFWLIILFLGLISITALVILFFTFRR